MKKMHNYNIYNYVQKLYKNFIEIQKIHTLRLSMLKIIDDNNRFQTFKIRRTILIFKIFSTTKLEYL